MTLAIAVKRPEGVRLQNLHAVDDLLLDVVHLRGVRNLHLHLLGPRRLNLAKTSPISAL